MLSLGGSTGALDQARPEAILLDFSVIEANAFPSLPKSLFKLQYKLHIIKYIDFIYIVH